MAYIQKLTPPPNKTLNFSLDNFVGGLNNRSEQLQPNEASSMMNMRFVDETVMENRYGQKYYDTLVLDSPVIFIDEFKPYADANVLLRATAGKFYINDLILTTISGKPCGTNHNGRYFFSDGVKLWVYGRFDQVTSTYCTIIGTPINNYVLLEIVSPASDATRLDTTHTQGVLNVDYTNFKVFYVPCQNEFVDTFSGANVVPSGVKFITSHNGRLFVSGDQKDDDNVFITDIQNPFYFPVTLPIQLPPNSDMVVGMCVYDNSVVVGRKEDIYAIYGSTNRTGMGVDVFQLRKLNSHTGFANQDAVKVAHNYMFFLGNDGNAYSLASTRTNEKLLSTTILTKNIDITKDPLNLSPTDIYTASSYFFKDEWHLSIGDKVLVYSYIHLQWTVYNMMDARSFYVINNQLIWGRSDGHTATFDETTFLDFGLPYQSYWYSKRFDMGDANAFKQFREFFLVAYTYEFYVSDVNITFEIDYDDVSDRVVVSNQMSVYGKAKWGDRYITRNISESLPFVIGRRGRSIRFKLSCSYNKDGEVATYADLEFYLGKKNGLLVYVTGESKYYLYEDGAWQEITIEGLNQRMKIFQVNGDYEMRGKR